MAQPRIYTQTTNFNDFTVTNPSDPHPGAKIDTELTKIKQNTDDLNTNIALIQRDDGKLKNEAVHKDSFDQDALALIGASGSGFVPKGDWTTATAYVSGDIVTNNDATYLTVSVSHTSGETFAGDKALGYWQLIANSAIETSAASVDVHTSIASQVLFTTTYTYSDPKDIQVFVNGLLTSHTLYTISNSGATSKDITFTTAPATGATVIIWGASVVAEAAKAGAKTYRDTASNHKVTAERWASLDTDSVTDAETSTDSGEYSAKAWAIGGTEVTQTALRGASKQWAIGTGRIDDQTTGGYSAKEHATGTTVAEGSAKSWASKDTSAVASSLYSAKEYASGVAASTGGSSKDWASKTTAIVDSADYSSKEWAAGQLTANTSGSAKQWAIGGGAFVEATAVEGSNYSAKRYASLTAADLVATNADVVSTNADVGFTNTDVLTVQGIYDQFDDRFLGPHTTAQREVGAANIGLDHDGIALVAGAMYFDTTLTIMKVWSGTAWQRMQPTTAEQTNIDAAVADAVDIGKVAAKDAEIGRLGAAAYSDGANAYLALLGTPAMANSTDGDIKVVADNIADVNNFAVRYRTGVSDPTTSLDDGDLFWNQTSDELKIYNTTASAWQVPYLDSASVNAEATNAAISMAIALG